MFFGFVLFALTAFSITFIEQCQSKELGPTVSLNINHRHGRPIGPVSDLLVPSSIVWQLLVPFCQKYYSNYDGMIVVQHIGEDATLFPKTVLTSADDLKSLNETIIKALNEILEGWDKRHKMERLPWMTVTLMKLRAEELDNSTTRVPVVYVLVDRLEKERSSWEHSARRFMHEEFDVFMIFDDFKNPTKLQIHSKYSQRQQVEGALAPADTLHQEIEKAMALCKQSNITKDDCYYVAYHKCGIPRPDGDYCFYPECPVEVCDKLCRSAIQDEGACNATCGSGWKTTQPNFEQRDVREFQYCPVELVPCTQAPCTTSTRKATSAPSSAPSSTASAVSSAVPDVMKEDAVTAAPVGRKTTGSNATQMVPTWQLMLVNLGVLLGAWRVWQ